ncbi:MarR family winged helix-turn-helix transcriptional regulator [Crossiella cryophila]|uniref:DNA-binding MarR family transcriptional regulator n=1 Tax=Crossiella cryophila TaxID=43355 RepID=A0A7W7C7Q1_9PSEU|nr:MarR family transcriptional regulator [Crossiella cryophila]MBB4674749.1 DNA-binding MarR family transcriptional regulator [Crossiella cryophila]
MDSDDPVRQKAAEAVERELALLMRRARSMSMSLAARIHPELDSAAYALLLLIDDRESVRATDLVEQLGLDKSTLSRQIAQLHRLELVERVADPYDGRARLVQLTASGRQRLSEVRTERRGKLREHFRTWSTGDLESLSGLLGRLNQDL